MLLVLLELVFVGLVVAGVAMLSVPAAFITAGVLGVLVFERAAIPARPRRERGEQ